MATLDPKHRFNSIKLSVRAMMEFLGDRQDHGFAVEWFVPEGGSGEWYVCFTNVCELSDEVSRADLGDALRAAVFAIQHPTETLTDV